MGVVFNTEMGKLLRFHTLELRSTVGIDYQIISTSTWMTQIVITQIRSSILMARVEQPYLMGASRGTPWMLTWCMSVRRTSQTDVPYS